MSAHAWLGNREFLPYLCGGINLCLPDVLALAEHGGGAQFGAVLARDEVGGLSNESVGLRVSTENPDLCIVAEGAHEADSRATHSSNNYLMRILCRQRKPELRLLTFKKMAARSLNGMFSHSGLAASALLMASSTSSGDDVENVDKFLACLCGIGWDDSGPDLGTCSDGSTRRGVQCQRFRIWLHWMTSLLTALPLTKAGT